MFNALQPFISIQIQELKISGSVLVARYRGCVTEKTSWSAEETRWNTMVNRRNHILPLLFPKVCLEILHTAQQVAPVELFKVTVCSSPSLWYFFRLCLS